MLATLTSGLATARLSRRALPALVPVLIATLGITSVQAGIALSTVAICYGLLQYPSGRLGDALTRKTAIVLSLSVLAIGSVVLALAPGFGALLVGAAIVGAGEGLYGPAARALLADLYEEQRGKAFGLFTMASDLGGVLAAGLVTATLAIATWNAVFVPIVFALAIHAIAIYRWGREPVHLARFEVDLRETVTRLFGHSRYRWLLASYVLFAFTAQGFVGFLPTFLQAHHDVSLGVANGLFALFFVAGMAARSLGGALSDRLPRRYVGGGGLVLSAGGVVVLLVTSSAIGAIPGILLAALGQKAFPPSIQAYLMDVFPDSTMGGDLGATRTVYLVLGSLGPTYIGYVASRWNYDLAFAGFVVCLLVAGTIMIGLSVTGSE